MYATLVQQIATLAPKRLTLVNFPGHLGERGLKSFAFWNGLHALSLSAYPPLPLEAVQYVYAPLPGGPVWRPSGSAPMDLDTLRKLVLDTSQVVLLFQEPGNITRLTPDILTQLTPR